MNVLVLGGNGFIGSHLLDKLLIEGHNIRVFDRTHECFREDLNGVKYYLGDFNDSCLLSQALVDIDIVFHLISTTTPQTSNENPLFDVRTNVLGSLSLLEKCVHAKIKKIVFVSSGGTVYGIPETLPVTEDSTTTPICSYGIGKLTVERYLHLFHSLYGMDYTIVRPANPYGARQQINSNQGVIPVFLGKILKKEPIEIWGDGSVVRDYIYIDDLVDGIYRAAITHAPSCIYNLGSGHGYSIKDVLAVIENVINEDCQVNCLAGRSFDIPAIYLDISRAQRELSWNPSISLERGIKNTWNFIRKTFR